MLCLQRGEDDGFYYTIITGAPVHEASQLNIFNTVKHGCCRHKKALKRTLIVLVLLSILLCALAFAAIHGAARLFNHTMSRQTMLRGTITVETLAPHITGYVQFTNLVWKDPDGHLILYVPDGSLSVRPWDIITRSIKSTTLTNITLNDATIAAYFDEKNQLDLIAQDEKEKKDGTEKKQHRSLQDRIRNINWNGQKLHASLDLHNCQLESYHMSRHYVMESVNAHIGMYTGKRADIQVSTGRFAGTAIGDGVAIKGKIDLTTPIPTMNMNVDIVNVDPSSLGFGDNIHDQMTLTFHATGPLDQPEARGHLHMERLNLPALRFTDVSGNVYYHDSLLQFTKVKAKVYGGTLDAYGDYNLETRAYNIYGHGEDLNSSTALHDMKFRTLVTMDITMRCDGNPRHLRAYGSFQSGSGYYFPLHFNSISGRFNNRYHELDFYDVVISTAMGDIATDALHIVNGEVQLSPVRIRDAESGETTEFRGLDNYKESKETQAAMGRNLKNLGRSMKSINQSIKSMKKSLDF